MRLNAMRRVDDTWQEAAPVRKMHFIQLNRHPDNLVQATLAEINRRASHYLANWNKSDAAIQEYKPKWAPTSTKTSRSANSF